MSDDRELLPAQLQDALRSARNGDGGWSYLPGRASRLEPTCWALLAQSEAAGEQGAVESRRAALALLARWQRQDGLLADTPGGPPNLAFNGLASLVLRRIAAAPPGSRQHGQEDLERRLLAGILSVRGVTVNASAYQRQNNALRAWPWVDRTFSWVEPTSWCLLALKKARQDPSASREPARVDEAERLLADRCCRSGGWNYGNANVLGQDLRPYVPTTAIALLALRDRREMPEVTRSLDWLRRNRQAEESTMALSVALVALRAYGEPADDLDAAVRAHIARSGFPANLATTALAAYALGGGRHAFDALAA